MKILKSFIIMVFLMTSLKSSAQKLSEFELVQFDKAYRLSQHEGKVVMLVNIATACGYTPQLKDLEGLHQKYKDKGLVVVGVPSNEFGGQTPEDNEGVVKFCKLNYGVSFPIVAKTKVKGSEANSLYQFIRKKRDGDDINWNFEKALFSRSGEFVAAYRSGVSPLNSELENKIKELLK